MRGRECSRMASDLGFVGQQFTGDLVVGGGHAHITVALIAGLGVVGLYHRFNQDHIGIGDRLLNMFSFFEIQAVLLQFCLEFIGQGHIRREKRR